MTLEDIYFGAGNLINGLIRKEHSAQGHYLTSELENSLEFEIRNQSLIGSAVYYAVTLNEGLRPDQISPKMFPGLINYFVLRGLSLEEAKKAAGATFNKWKNEGMSTQASKRFSSTGGRQHFIEAAMLNPAIDEYMSNTLDFVFPDLKNETV